EQLSEEELAKVLPQRLAGRIKKRFPAVLSSSFTKNYKTKTKNLSPVSASSPPKTENCIAQLAPRPLQPILEIDQHRPDRIIFMGEKIKVTDKEFSLIHLLAQHNGQVMSYDELLDTLWRNEEDAIYSRVSFHISKVRRSILKLIGESKINKEKVKNIFVVIPKRGVMIKLKAEEIKIN
ncbi:unnamed protein product, partial [marine sediment metagenome]